MQRKYKMLIGIALILIVLLLSWAGMIWYDSDFEADYPKQRLTFTGDLIGGKLEYRKLSIDLADYREYDNKGKLEENPIKKIYNDCSLVLHVNKNSLKVVDITPLDFKELGGEYFAPGKNRRVFAWRIFSPAGFNPPYVLTGQFYEDKILSIIFGLQNPPSTSMSPPKPCPISFSFGESGAEITFPIKAKKIKEYLGPPAKIRRYMKWP